MGFWDRLMGRKTYTKKDLIKAGLYTEPVVSKVPPLTEAMDEDTFWELIARTRSESNGDYERQQSALGALLEKLEATEIEKFDNRFGQYHQEVYTWELWAAAYIMNGGCSDDCFSDFRGWLIAQGKKVFFDAIKDPETLAQLEYDQEEVDWEGFTYIAGEAYQKVKGTDMPFHQKDYPEITGQEWEENDKLYEKYPKLSAKWSY